MADTRGRFEWVQPLLTGLLLLTVGGASSSIKTYLSAFREDITSLKLQVAKLETALSIKGDARDEKVFRLETLCAANDSRIDGLERWQSTWRNNRVEDRPRKGER